MIATGTSTARKDLGDDYELVAIGELATSPHLLSELKLEERLSEMIDQNIKRLMHPRGLKRPLPQLSRGAFRLQRQPREAKV